MKDGFFKVAAGTPRVRLGDCRYNAGEIVYLCRWADEKGVSVLCLPELCLTGASCGDLFFQRKLLRDAESSLCEILRQTEQFSVLTVTGLPVAWRDHVYNCAAVLYAGRLLGIVPKTHIPGTQRRWFSPKPEFHGPGAVPPQTIRLAGQEAVFSAKQTFRCEETPELCIGVEIGEDALAPCPPSAGLASEGCTVILNPAAETEVAGLSAKRRSRIAAQSERLRCAYVSAGAGAGESTGDGLYAGHCLIAENGVVLSECRFEPALAASEADVFYLSDQRKIQGFFSENTGRLRETTFSMPLRDTELSRPVAKNPFVNGDPKQFEEILTIQSLSLKKRMESAGLKKIVLGVSGGLDSTLALLVSVRTMDRMNLPRGDVLAVTMPCFGTTQRTRSNAEKLCEALGTSFRTVDISQSVSLHLSDIGHEPSVHNAAYENAQARERTQVLMDIANDIGGLVVGTGDLSEMALGWCTYNGDHMSMYGVNGGVTKTMVRLLVSEEAEKLPSAAAAVLRDILNTPVSPELLPPSGDDMVQKTEELVGPYELHDFFLYYSVHCGFGREKILRLAEKAFQGIYEKAEIEKWLSVFQRRFVTQQFKRSCMPDGPAATAVSLSPRGALVLPSDLPLVE